MAQTDKIIKSRRARFTNADALIDDLEKTSLKQAVIMSLIIVGEASTKIMDGFPEFVAQHNQVPWRSMRGMRNRIAHGYFDINLDVVWDTVQTALPDLIEDISRLRQEPI
jgi:uncharacterized protein with HEPN domain